MASGLSLLRMASPCGRLAATYPRQLALSSANVIAPSSQCALHKFLHSSPLSLHDSPSLSAPRLSLVPHHITRAVPQSSTSTAGVGELPAKLQKIVESFQMVPDPRARYQQLLFYASRLPPLPAEHRNAENKVPGCVSQVWVVPSLAPDGTMAFQADSDSALTKGLAALLCEGLTGATPQQVMSLEPSFISALGLQQSLTPSRNNGFLNMLKLMQRRTLQLAAAEGAAATPGTAATAAAAAASATATVAAAAAVSAGTAGSIVSSGTAMAQGSDGGAAGGEANGSMAAAGGNGGAAASLQGGSSASGSGASGSGSGSGSSVPAAIPGAEGRPVYAAMMTKIQQALSPVSLVVDDVSHQHAGHAGNPSGNGESHFNVKVVSASFSGLPTIRRHRLIYGLLGEEFKAGLHALSLVTRTPEEEEKMGN